MASMIKEAENEVENHMTVKMVKAVPRIARISKLRITPV